MRSKKKISLLVAVMLLGAVGFSTSSVVANEPEEVVEVQVEQENILIKNNKQLLEEAQSAIDRKDFDIAIGYLSSYIESKPKRYEAYKLRGQCYYELRQYKLAQQDFETAVKLKTDDDKFMTGAKVLGAMVLGADKEEQYQNPELGNLYALLMYAQKAQNDPNYESSYQEAGRYNSHIYLPKPDKNEIAKINCPQKYGKKFNQTGVDAYINDAILDIEKKDFHEAMYKIQYITSNYPKYFLGHYLSGVALVGLDQEAQAIREFETSLNLNPQDFESYASLGEIYYLDAEKSLSKFDVDKSIYNFKKALELNPNCYIYHYYIGLNHLQMNDYPSAIKSFDSAIKIKADDYNSRYYKAISQYMIGDYNAVVEETSALLLKHVSNYNSVLYLRALANYKLGQISDATADIEKIQKNMNDVYNADIRRVSSKEQTLDSYVSYLKSKILSDNGGGVISDLDNAFSNPIIKDLDSMVSKGVLSASVPLGFKDIENQYDYIRTTFSNLNLRLVNAASNYKITAQKSAGTPVVLKEKADDIMLLDGGENSIAKILASNGLKDIQPQFAEVVSNKNLNEEEQRVQNSFDNPLIEADKIEVVNTPIVSQNLNIEKSDIQEVANGVKLVADEIKITEDFKISYPQDEILPKVDLDAVKKSVEEVNVIEDFKISYSKDELLPTANLETVKKTAEENIPVETFNITYPKAEEETPITETFNITYPKASDVEVSNNEKIVEKQAVVNLTEFNVSNKSLPMIKDTDEVIVFEPQKNIFKADTIVSQPTFNITIPKELPKLPANVTEMDQVTETVVEQNDVEPKEVAVSESETVVEINNPIEDEVKIEIKTVDADSVDVEKIAQERVGKVETTSSNPMLQRIMIPSIEAPAKSFNEAKKDVEDVVASKSIEVVDVISDAKSIVVDDTKLIEKRAQEMAELNDAKLAQAKEILEDVLGSVEEVQELESITPVSKTKKSKTKTKKKNVAKANKKSSESDSSTENISVPEKEISIELQPDADIDIDTLAQAIFDNDIEKIKPYTNIEEVEKTLKNKKVKVKKERIKKEKVKKIKKSTVEPISEELNLVDNVVTEVQDESQIDLTPAVTYINPEKPKKERKIKFSKPKFLNRSKAEKTVDTTEILEKSEQADSKTKLNRKKFFNIEFFGGKVSESDVNKDKKVIKSMEK